MLLVCLLAPMSQVQADTVLSPFVPIFKGVYRAVGTNTPGGTGMPHLQIINMIRVDRTDPDLKLFSTPPIANWASDVRETGAMTVGRFISNYKVQLAINGNDFKQYVGGGSPAYGLTEGTPLILTGVMVSQGQVVSDQQSYDQYNCAMFINSDGITYNFNNWPASPTTGVDNALCGTHPIVIDGVNVGYDYIGNSDFVHQVQPRTILGSSQDSRYLYMVTIDGRQTISEGALDWEAGVWLLMAGVYNAINMDGGGSTTLDMASSTGSVIQLNHSSSVAAYGYERSVGAHLGVIAKPVPGVINDVTANADNTAASITWTTVQPASTQIKWGTATNLANSTARINQLSTNHSALLTNLLPNTGYYYQALSIINGLTYSSSTFYFVTSNYVTTNVVFDIGNTWSYTSDNMDGTAWKTKAYADNSWDTGTDVFWVDVRGANTAIPSLSTALPGDPNNFGYPFPTYYFRTHFTYTNSLAGVTLLAKAYVDDGAVFYLNGGEIYRLRMAAYPTAINNASSATAAAPGPTSDATIPDRFEIKGSPMTNLVTGDNVLAVEVHNRPNNNPDITFGMSLQATPQYNIQPEISALSTNGNQSILSWPQGGFTLYQGNTVTGAWTVVQGPSGNVVSSPYVVTNTSAAKFFRLAR